METFSPERKKISFWFLKQKMFIYMILVKIVNGLKNNENININKRLENLGNIVLNHYVCMWLCDSE